MEKQQIRLTEEDLHAIISESVEQILMQEGWWSDLKAAAKPWANMGRGMASNASNKVSQAASNQYKGARNAVGSAYNNAKNAVSGAYNNAKNAVGGAYNNAKNAVGGAYNNAKNAVGGAYNKAAEFGRAGMESSRMSINLNRLNTARENAVQSLNNYIQAAQKCGGISAQKIGIINQALEYLQSDASNFAGNMASRRANANFARKAGLR